MRLPARFRGVKGDVGAFPFRYRDHVHINTCLFTG